MRLCLFPFYIQSVTTLVITALGPKSFIDAINARKVIQILPTVIPLQSSYGDKY